MADSKNNTKNRENVPRIPKFRIEMHDVMEIFAFRCGIAHLNYSRNNSSTLHEYSVT
jgi:hypothetical protein